MLKYWEWFLHLFFHCWGNWGHYGYTGTGWPIQVRTCQICGKKQVRVC